MKIKNNSLLKISLIIVMIMLIVHYKNTGRSANVKNNHNNNGSDFLTVGSYNLRYDAEVDVKSGNGWDLRKKPLANVITENDMDIVGTQEGDFNQMEDLMDIMPGYNYIGYPYGGSEGNLHTASIIYKKDQFEINDKGVFWYSETPDKKSIGWDADDLRIGTWAKIKDKYNSDEFYFFSSHFYWKHHIAKEHSGEVMVNKIKEVNSDNLPVISTGDLNSTVDTPQLKDILAYLDDSRKIAKESPKGPKNTNLGGGNFKGDPVNRIDYILVNDKVNVLTYSTLMDMYKGDDGENHYPADHLPVLVEVGFMKE